ncbi:MAG TPA: hypothetical protein VE224_04550, partial [Pseudolabrys sp.]|nr:hypothetical protein [Pseudolabrys sp.]
MLATPVRLRYVRPRKFDDGATGFQDLPIVKRGLISIPQMVGLATVVAIIAILQGASQAGLLNPFIVPAPS